MKSKQINSYILSPLLVILFSSLSLQSFSQDFYYSQDFSQSSEEFKHQVEIQRHKPQLSYPYYGKEFYEKRRRGLQNRELKNELFKILTSFHMSQKDDFDLVQSSCKKRNCYKRVIKGYMESRRFLLGNLHLKKRNGIYSIKGFYCLKKFSGRGIGPGKIPSYSLVNTEHAWPQSHFSIRFSKLLQQTDLHHIYPADSRVNSTRGNYRYAEIKDENIQSIACKGTKLGRVEGSNKLRFEPPDIHKGDLARSMFYFSVRYKLQINPIEEKYLRKWHAQDPVSHKEVRRQKSIYKFQKNRNPFIDHPQLVDEILDF